MTGSVSAILMAVLAGIVFGIWPLVLRTSNLKGSLASMIFSFIVGALIVPAVMLQGGFATVGTIWSRVAIAGVLGAAGLVMFNTILAQAKPAQAATLFMIVNITQVVVIAIYAVYDSGGSITNARIIGFLLAGAAVYLLLK